MIDKKIFCKARNKSRYIQIEDCVPNPCHPVCIKCDSPNIEPLPVENIKKNKKDHKMPLSKSKKTKEGIADTQDEIIYDDDSDTDYSMELLYSDDEDI